MALLLGPAGLEELGLHHFVVEERPCEAAAEAVVVVAVEVVAAWPGARGGQVTASSCCICYCTAC